MICSFNRGVSQKKDENDWYPSGISIDSMNTVYVSSGMENSLSIFNNERQFVKKFSLSKWKRNYLFVGVAVDNAGNLLVCDQYNNSIVVY